MPAQRGMDPLCDRRHHLPAEITWRSSAEPDAPAACVIFALGTLQRVRGIVARARAKQLHASFYPALVSLGTSVPASCAGPWSYSPPQTSAVPPPAAWMSPPRPAIPRPARKPSPLATIQTPAPEAGGGALAMTEPGPTAPALGPADALPLVGPSTTSPLPKASELIGLDQQSATRLLGAAAEQFEQPPAVVWRYKTATCELDLFFYLDLRSGKMRALHYSFKCDGADATKQQNCVRSLVTT